MKILIKDYRGNIEDFGIAYISYKSMTKLLAQHELTKTYSDAVLCIIHPTNDDEITTIKAEKNYHHEQIVLFVSTSSNRFSNYQNEKIPINGKIRYFLYYPNSFDKKAMKKVLMWTPKEVEKFVGNVCLGQRIPIVSTALMILCQGYLAVYAQSEPEANWHNQVKKTIIEDMRWSKREYELAENLSVVSQFQWWCSSFEVMNGNAIDEMKWQKLSEQLQNELPDKVVIDFISNLKTRQKVTAVQVANVYQKIAELFRNFC